MNTPQTLPIPTPAPIHPSQPRRDEADQTELQALGRGAGTERLLRDTLRLMTAAARDAVVLDKRVGFGLSEREQLTALYMQVRHGAEQQKLLRQRLSNAIGDRRVSFELLRSWLRKVAGLASTLSQSHPRLATSLGLGENQVRASDPLAARAARVLHQARSQLAVVQEFGIDAGVLFEGGRRLAKLERTLRARDETRRQLAARTAELLEARGRLVRRLRLLRLAAGVAFARDRDRLQAYEMARVRRKPATARRT